MAGENDGADETAVEATQTSGNIDDSVTEHSDAPVVRADPALGVVGRFRLESRLGAGGMGDVYRAYDPALDRAVALKVLRVRGDAGNAALPQQMRRVLREARAAAALTHPNTVTIFDVGEADGEVFIAMELLAGETLRSAIRQKRGDLATKLRWLREAANALSAAHERGLVHRDVKPDNMFVCEPSGTLKLLDFGIAKRDETVDPEGDTVVDTAPDSIGPSSLRTEAGVRVGTPRYMAPEQKAGLGTDARTDQFAWGLIAFELLTGSHPVSAPATVTNPSPNAGGAPALSTENVRGTLAKIPGLPPQVAGAIARSLERLQDDRFASMAELIAALDARPVAKKRLWLWPVAAVATLGALTAGTFAGLKATKPRVVPEAPPRCQVEGIRSIPISEDDRIGAMPNGDIVLARQIKQGLTITKESGDAGAAPITTNPVAQMFLGMFAKNPEYDNVTLSGIQLKGEPWVYAYVDQPFPAGPLLIGVTANSYATDRISPPTSGVVFTAFGNDHLVIGVTTPKTGNRFGGLPDGAEVYISNLVDGPRPVPVEEGDAFAPSIATSADNTRIAFTYALTQSEMRQSQQLAILDELGQRATDIKSIRTAAHAFAAVAFAEGTRAVVFWVEDLGSTTRLRSSTFAPGDPAPSAPKTAVDEIAMDYRPVTARLPTGSYAAAWVGSAKGAPTLRIAPLAPNGDLVGPANVATLPTKVEALTAATSERGIALSWREADASGARTAKIAQVTCH